MNDNGARKLAAAILKQAQDDYVRPDIEEIEINKQYHDAKQFIHSDWAEQLCEGLETDQSAYIKICKAKRAWLNKLWEIVNKRKLTKKRKKNIITRATTVLPSLTTDQITAMLDGDKKQWDDFIKDNLKIG